MAFVWLSEETVIFVLYITNRSGFITEVKSVYSAVRTESLYKAYVLSLNSYVASVPNWFLPSLQYADYQLNFVFLSPYFAIGRRLRPVIWPYNGEDIESSLSKPRGLGLTPRGVNVGFVLGQNYIPIFRVSSFSIIQLLLVLTCSSPNL
jgi:hypothetical protein